MALTKATFGVVSSALASGNATDGYVLTADGSGGTAWEASAGGVDGIVSSADATAITIDSSENVGIGTSSPDNKLHVFGADSSGSSAGTCQLTIENSGASGLQFLAGTTSYSEIRFGDSGDNGVGWIQYDHTNNYQSFGAAGTERMRVTSSGKVGIGVNPAFKLQVSGTQNDNDICSHNSTTGSSVRISSVDAYGSVFTTGAYDMWLGANNTERMRIMTGRSEVLINRTSAFGSGSSASLIIGSASDQTMRVLGPNTSGYTWIGFFNGGLGQIGSISNNGNTATSYNTTSDHRLKENVVAMTGSIDRVKQLQPKRFNWIVDESNTLVDGFLAHEAQTVVAEAVTGVHNETKELSNVVLNSSNSVLATDITEEEWTAGKVDTLWTEEDELPDGVSVGDVRMEAIYPSDSTWNATYAEPIYQGIDQSKLVPLLTGALQEAITKIEQLETRIETLENA